MFNTSRCRTYVRFDTVHASPPIAADDVGSSPELGETAAEVPEVPLHHLLPARPDVAEAVALWDARAEHAIGVLIERYVAECPCPGPSLIETDLLRWAERLRDAGAASLQAQGQQRLRAV